LAGYTHFTGSKVYAVDSGTSAAAPVVAGVIAALRTAQPYNPIDPLTTPAFMRQVLQKTATDRGPSAYDYEYGWGVINPAKAAGLSNPKGNTPPRKKRPAKPKP
jgi:subtilisin family serine protease